MGNNVVIDKDILGWGNDHQRELLKQYDKVLKVGVDPELPQRSFDDRVASYCKDNNCDLLTGDSRAYIHYFEVGVKTVQITRYAWYTEGDKPIYLIKIVE